MDFLINISNTMNGQTVMTTALTVATISTIVMLFCLRKQSKLLAQVNKLSEELRVANRGAIGMGQQIIALEKKLQAMRAPALKTATAVEEPIVDEGRLAEAIEPNDILTVENDKLSLARDLLAKGQSLTEVASACQLSFAEVSLLRALHSTGTSNNQPHTH